MHIKLQIWCRWVIPSAKIIFFPVAMQFKLTGQWSLLSAHRTKSLLTTVLILFVNVYSTYIRHFRDSHRGGLLTYNRYCYLWVAKLSLVSPSQPQALPHSEKWVMTRARLRANWIFFGQSGSDFSWWFSTWKPSTWRRYNTIEEREPPFKGQLVPFGVLAWVWPLLSI